MIGRVWANHGQPDPAVGLMPEGTVAAKLLFTTAPVQDVPYLQGAPVWTAYVYADPNDPTPTPASPRPSGRARTAERKPARARSCRDPARGRNPSGRLRASASSAAISATG